MGIENLGYVRLQVTDPKAWADFAVDVLGFGIAEHDDRKWLEIFANG